MVAVRERFHLTADPAGVPALTECHELRPY